MTATAAAAPPTSSPLRGTGRGGSQGFANNGGFGVLLDRGGSDTYEIVGDQGLPLRGDGVTILPGVASTGSGGVFRDM